MMRIQRLVPIVLGGAWLTLSACNGKDGGPRSAPFFTDITPGSGITIRSVSGDPEKLFLLEAKGLGCAFIDYDNDGFLDLYVVNGTTFDYLYGRLQPAEQPVDRLYRNLGGGKFQDVTIEAGVADPNWSYGVTAGDYDADGHIDLFVCNYGANRLFHNNGDGTFTDVAPKAGVTTGGWSTGAAFGDYDKDGDLDLYVAAFVDYDFKNLPNDGKPCPYMGFDVMCGPMGLAGAQDHLYRNNGDGTFTDVTARAGMLERKPYYGFTPVWEDFDNDGNLDLYVPNDSCPNYMYRNKGDGTFEEIGTISGTNYSGDGKEQASMGCAVQDYDVDGLMDIFLTHFSDDHNTLYHNDGGFTFTDVSQSSGVGPPSMPMCAWGTFFIDFDHDADLDLFVANGHVYPVLKQHPELNIKYEEPNQMFENNGAGRFTDVSAGMGPDFTVPKVSRGAAYADIDNDGDLDICVTHMDDIPTLFRNDCAGPNHWVTFVLKGTRSSPDGIGALVKVTAGGRTQSLRVRSGGSFLSHSDLRPNFGLGGASAIDRVEIDWPMGLRQVFTNVAADQFVEIVEGRNEIRAVRYADRAPSRPAKP